MNYPLEFWECLRFLRKNNNHLCSMSKFLFILLYVHIFGPLCFLYIFHIIQGPRPLQKRATSALGQIK